MLARLAPGMRLVLVPLELLSTARPDYRPGARDCGTLEATELAGWLRHVREALLDLTAQLSFLGAPFFRTLAVHPNIMGGALSYWSVLENRHVRLILRILLPPLIRNCPAQHQESPKLWIPRPTPARGLKVTFFARMVCCYPCCRRFLPTCTRASHAATRNWHATRPLFQLRLPPGASHWALCDQLPTPDRQKVRAASRQSSHRVVGSARGSGKMQRAGRVLKSTLAPKPCSSAR